MSCSPPVVLSSTSITMSAALGSSTTIRALPSTLALRATPTVPPATQAYEPLVKSVLRHRLLGRIFAFSAIFNWAIVVLATTTRQGGLRSLGLIELLLSPILPRTLVLTCIIWLLSAVPIVVMRKTNLTGACIRHKIAYYTHTNYI